MFSLQDHVIKPTRKGKNLIDHISSNIPSKLIYEVKVNYKVN